MMRKTQAQRSFAGALVLLGLAIGIALGCRAAAAQESEAPREVGRIRSRDLSEISGLAASRRNPDVLWMHNDGESREVFAVATTGKLVARVRVPLQLEDVEDIAIGPGPEKDVDYIYLGDIGDNAQRRREVRVVRFAEPALEAGHDNIKADGVEEFRLKYPDGARDAEALMVDPATGDVFLVTKDDRRTRLYRMAGGALNDGGTASLELIGYLKVDAVSGGDISRAGDVIVLRNEKRGWLWQRQVGENVAAALEGAPRIVLTRGLGQAANGESIGFDFDGSRYYTISEGEFEPIYVFAVPEASGGAGD